jgi:benzylsuccinate CoA-transferase BbsF subunit
MERAGALEGVKVVDFGLAGVGPLHAKCLGDHGATVIRVETHTRPDVQRLSRPFKDNEPGIDRSGMFTTCNSSKYSITLDLAQPKGKEIALRLVKWADVICVGMIPSAVKRLGLDYGSLERVKPDIIYLSTSLMGEYGPYAEIAGFGFQACAVTGIFHLMGWPDRMPGGLWGAYTDYISPYFGVAAILAALDYRRRTGKGQHLDESQVECALHFVAPVVMDYGITGRVLNRNGNRLPYAAPHGVYPCQGDDRWIAIAIFSDDDWQALCKVIGTPKWTKDPKFATFKGRKENEDELDRLIAEWTNTLTAEEVMFRMQGAGVPTGVVQNTKDLFEDPQLKHRRHFRWLHHSVMGPHCYDGPAFRLSKTPDEQFAAPALGEHNEYVYKDALGLSDDEIAELLIEKVITTDADLPKY